VSEGNDNRPTPEGPSIEDFWAADEEAERRPRSLVSRMLIGGLALLLIAALIAYFVVPFNNFFGSVTYHLWHPNTGVHTIPLAPERKANPKLPA